MISKMSLGKIKAKASVTKRTKRISLKEQNASNGGDVENEDTTDINICSITPVEATAAKRTENIRGGFRQRIARRASSGILKNIRRKLTLNRTRNSVRESGVEHNHPEESELGFNSLTATKKSTKQPKSSMRTICPMPSLIQLHQKSSNHQHEDIKPSILTSSSVSSNPAASTSTLGKSVSLRASSTDSIDDRSAENGSVSKNPTNRTGANSANTVSAPNVRLSNDESLQNYATPSPQVLALVAETPLEPGAATNMTAHSEDISDLYPTPRTRSLTVELVKLPRYGWYWGPITRNEAEEKLVDQPDGAFLVRDSSDDRYLLSLSFRSFGKTLHTRIEHSNGTFSFYSQPESDGHSSIIDLIEHSMNYSQSGVFCYSRARTPGAPSYPVRLTKPVSRFTQVRSLQYLCRFVIRQNTRIDLIHELPLPNRMKGYVEERQF